MTRFSDQPLPDHLVWTSCSCGHASCKRSYPTNLGNFYQGTGFDPDERKLLDKAFAALAQLPAAQAAEAAGRIREIDLQQRALAYASLAYANLSLAELIVAELIVDDLKAIGVFIPKEITDRWKAKVAENKSLLEAIRAGGPR